MSIIFLLYSSDVSFYLHNLVFLSSFFYLIEEQKFPNPILLFLIIQNNNSKDF